MSAAAGACEPQGTAAATLVQVVAPSPPPASPPPPTTITPADAGLAADAPVGGLAAPPGSLDALYGALASAEARTPGGRAGLVFFGDSHTAGDAMTGRIRTVLQERFGDGGRGFVLAGKPPVRHYYQRHIRYGSEGRWLAELGGRRDASEPFGIGGVRVHGADRGARAWVETCAECPFSGRVGRFDVYYLRTPGSGHLAYRIDDGDWKKLATRTSASPAPDVLSIPVDDGPHRLTLRPGGGGAVELFGVALERERPGVVVDSVGVVGRRLAHLVSWDWSVIGPQLERRDPRLVVLQYGTNEAEETSLDLGLLARRYDEAIARVRAAAPRASILILGPPDMARRPGGSLCSGEAASARPGASPPRVTRPGVPATSLAGPAGIEPRVGIDPLTGSAVPPECQWLTPARLPAIVEVQRHAAERAGVAFFDSLAAMGGLDRMDLFFHLAPPLAYSDRVHFTAHGYEHWADLLLAELLAGYDEWKQRAESAR